MIKLDLNNKNLILFIKPLVKKFKSRKNKFSVQKMNFSFKINKKLILKDFEINSEMKFYEFSILNN